MEDYYCLDVSCRQAVNAEGRWKKEKDREHEDKGGVISSQSSDITKDTVRLKSVCADERRADRLGKGWTYVDSSHSYTFGIA